MTMRKAFTLIEINLAMLIMAGGILSVVGLYALGFRESGQSREDLSAAALADAFISPLVMAISSTNVTWNDFKDLPNFPGNKGWGEFVDEQTGLVKQDPYRDPSSWVSRLNVKSEDWVGLQTAQSALSSVKQTCGIVIMHEKDSPVVSIGFRAVDRNKVGTLMSMPLFFTEVRYQGDPNK